MVYWLKSQPKNKISSKEKENHDIFYYVIAEKSIMEGKKILSRRFAPLSDRSLLLSPSSFNTTTQNVFSPPSEVNETNCAAIDSMNLYRKMKYVMFYSNSRFLQRIS